MTSVQPLREGPAERASSAATGHTQLPGAAAPPRQHPHSWHKLLPNVSASTRQRQGPRPPARPRSSPALDGTSEGRVVLDWLPCGQGGAVWRARHSGDLLPIPCPHQGDGQGRAGRRGNGRAGKVGSRPASRSTAHCEPAVAWGGGRTGGFTCHSQDNNFHSCFHPGPSPSSSLPGALMLPSHPPPLQAGTDRAHREVTASGICLGSPRWPQAVGGKKPEPQASTPACRAWEGGSSLHTPSQWVCLLATASRWASNPSR